MVLIRFVALLMCVFMFGAVFGQGGVVNSDELQHPEHSGELSDPDKESPSAWLLTPLKAYDAPLSALTRYRFSFVRYLYRGYDYSTEGITLNGIDLSNPISGYPFWSVVNALQHTPVEERWSEGFSPGVSLMGDVRPVREYRIDPLNEPYRGRTGWIFTDRRFRMGARMSITSGVLPGGWAVLSAATRRWGWDQHIAGVYSDDWTLTLSAAKRWGEKHTLTATFLMAPSERGGRSASTHQAFDLTGDPLYNPAWGYQQGRTRSSRVRRDRIPMGILGWRYTPNSNWEIHSSVSFLWGTSARSMADWYDAEHPLPDYYRYMPDYYENPLVRQAVREAWQNGDPRVTQIRWDEIYRSNRNRDTLAAAYVVSSAVEQYRNLQWTSFFSHRPSGWMSVQGGLRVRLDRTTFYNRLDDLLGASYLSDVDPYLIDDQYFGQKLHNDMRHPDRKVCQGERYGHQFDLDYARYEGWIQTDLQHPDNERFGGYVALQASEVFMSRYGYYEKELYPGSASYGPSERRSFTEYMFKAGVHYYFTPVHGLSLEFCGGERAPSVRSIFLSPEYRNQIIASPCATGRLGGELCYRYTGSEVRVEVRGYVTTSGRENEVRSYYDDLAQDYSDMVLTQIGKLYTGVEIGAEWFISRQLRLRVSAAQNWNSYLNDPSVSIFSNKSGKQIVSPTVTHLRGYRLGGSPQRVASAELSYQGSRMWMVSLSGNYVADHYVTPNPLNRMRRIYDYAVSAEERQAFVAQERLPNAFTVDLFVSKTFGLGQERYLTFSGSVHNLLNRKDIIYSGYEPMRVHRTGTGLEQHLSRFGSKYLYSYPRTYYLTVSFRF